MKSSYLILFLTPFLCAAQDSNLDKIITQAEVEAHIYFLASDVLRGRGNNTPEIEIAAEYIAQRFKAYGATPAVKDSYFQQVDLFKSNATSGATLALEEMNIRQGEGLLVVVPSSIDLQAATVFAEYGMESDLDGLSVEGKVVVTKIGSSGSGSKGLFQVSMEKKARLEEMGAAALVELYDQNEDYWQRVEYYLNQPHHELSGAVAPAGLPIAWIKGYPEDLLKKVKKGKNMALSFSPAEKEPWEARNVVGVVEGTDSNLKNEFVILTAHYDHMGVDKPVDGDSIYNGARDNGIGVAALLSAAQFFGKNPPARSILFLAVGAEEVGILGSKWYVDNPVRPLNQTVFNLNTDGAGYNDKSKITVVGLGRTSADEHLFASSKAYELEAIPDPAPEQNLFDRSDNVHFARAGIPAVDFAPGMSAFDQEISKYYHQPQDEVGSLDFDYVHLFVKAYVEAAQRIANANKAPVWKEGDKYEMAAKKLYNK